MSVKRIGIASLLAMFAALVVPGMASAAPVTQELFDAKSAELNGTFIALACVLVLLMQCGFMFLEIGFSRMKNAGAGVMKIFVNFSVCTLAFWAVGAAIIGYGNDFIGTHGFFYHFGSMVDDGSGTGTLVAVDSSAVMYMLYSFAFCAVSLAIVWGTTLERIKFAPYIIYAAVFGAVIYPMVGHSVWGGGLLTDIGGKSVMDFAGSSVVHLTGAVGGFVALLLLGARKGKYAADGSPRAIPGHSMPLVGLGIIILWIGWFGFNGGSTLGTDLSFFGEVMWNTQIAAAAGVIGAMLFTYMKTKSLDVGMAGNGAIAGLVAITAPCGFVETWTAPIIGFIAGGVVVIGVLTIEKYLDDPIGALSAHGLAGIWGTLAVGIFASPRLTISAPGIWYGIFGDADFGATLGQLGVQALAVVATFTFVFAASYLVFGIIKATIGLRVTEAEEDAGLDIASHGMYGYPEAFIPQPELPVGEYTPSMAGTPVASSAESPSQA
ncbi:MAG TPA: ammonium transporter [Solirubrobacterales bacterium]|nr:ammonium transporter [Solirubrobacterales bacterium]HNC93346.1 ammonium transporter [Solirubrobacterales bacterium]HNK35365.1 ammonium transporter [Solirubrobacterales bacterium]HNN18552.1 ammonium transporter [Solirubrobacterales bacterium]